MLSLNLFWEIGAVSCLWLRQQHCSLWLPQIPGFPILIYFFQTKKWQIYRLKSSLYYDDELPTGMILKARMRSRNIWNLSHWRDLQLCAVHALAFKLDPKFSSQKPLSMILGSCMGVFRTASCSMQNFGRWLYSRWWHGLSQYLCLSTPSVRKLRRNHYPELCQTTAACSLLNAKRNLSPRPEVPKFRSYFQASYRISGK